MQGCRVIEKNIWRAAVTIISAQGLYYCVECTVRHIKLTVVEMLQKLVEVCRQPGVMFI